MNRSSRVLIVDDDPAAAALLAASLDPALFSVAAVDGPSALRACAEGPPDLVLLDVEMPGMDGYDTCRQLRPLPGMADVPVIFCSGHAGIEERLKGYGAGGDDYLSKPFEAAELRAKVGQALARRQRHLQLARELEEMTHVALSTADMAGEAGVVLEFQRQLSGCTHHAQLARQLLLSLAQFQLDGCVRVVGPGGPVLLNSRGEASALEASILEHLQARPGTASVHGLGPHAGFRQAGLALFVRQLPVDRPQDMDRTESERIGRHVDNVALLLQGAAAQLQALEARAAAQALSSSQDLVRLTRDALVDLAARGHAQRLQARQILGQLADSVEMNFLSLGLSHDQEDQLSSLVRTHSDRVLVALEAGQELEARLVGIIRQLEQSPGAAPAQGLPRTSPPAPASPTLRPAPPAR